MDEVTRRCATALYERCGVVPGQRLLVGCSGGADSVALVHALRALGHPLLVVFVDHGLRDVTRERDAARAAAGPRFVVTAVEIGAGGNVQARARAARYAALQQLADAHGIADIAVAHTRTDQAETVLARLVRGAGPHGLAAMSWRSGRLIRPLLDVGRDETRGLGLAFVDDPTNGSDAHQRNRLRRRVMPLLVAENPRVEAALAGFATRMAGQRALIDVLVGRADDLDLRGLELDAIEALLHARCIKAGLIPRAEPLSAWARALRAGRTEHFPLGGDLIGLAAAGHAGFKHVPDPRTRVAAWGPGTYRRGHIVMEIRRAPMSSTLPISIPTASVAEADVVWPLVLEGTSDASHLRGHRVVDGAGRSLCFGSAGTTSPISEGIPASGGTTMAIHVGISDEAHGDVVAEDEGKLPLNG